MEGACHRQHCHLPTPSRLHPRVPVNLLTHSCPGATQRICSYYLPPASQPGLTPPRVSPALGIAAASQTVSCLPTPSSRSQPCRMPEDQSCPRSRLLHPTAWSPSLPGSLWLVITAVLRHCAEPFPSLVRGVCGNKPVLRPVPFLQSWLRLKIAALGAAALGIVFSTGLWQVSGSGDAACSR